MLNITRTAHIFKDNAWHITPFEKLKKGDIFRLFEEDGEPVHNNDGSVISIAMSDVFKVKNENGEDTFGIKKDPYTMKENK